MKGATAVFLVFLGCMSNVISLEQLVKEDPGCGNLITFAQFAFIAIEGFVFTSKFGTAPTHISKKSYFALTCLFFLVNLLNNYAFDFNVPVPLHIILRSGSLMTNMALGVLLLKKTYPLKKYTAVILLTVGIALCTIISGKDVKSTNSRAPPTTSYEDFFWWTIGIIILVIALFLSAALGIYQEILFKKFGKHPMEALFYTHLLPLPFFVFVYRSIYEHAILAVESEPFSVFELFTVPKSVFYLFMNVLSQFVCISSVYVLVTECSSLVVTLVLTLRKFSSLIFSVVYFRNPFTIYHWAGTFLVIIGTIAFTDLDEKFVDFISGSKQDVTRKKSN